MTHETATQDHVPDNTSGKSSAGTEEPRRDPIKTARTNRLIRGLVGGVAVIGLLWWLWTVFFAARTEKTDDAYTAVELSQVTPLTGGPVKAVYVSNTQIVHAGEILFALDATDQTIAVNQATAALEIARRQVRQMIANDVTLVGQVSMQHAAIQVARANLIQARASLDKANLDAHRRKLLAGPGAISEQELTDSETVQQVNEAAVSAAQAHVSEAEAALSAAAGARNANRVLFADSTVETNPQVLAARTRLDAAKVDLDRTVIRAPVAGVVDQRSVEVGQRVQAGVPVMVVVPISSIYVDANFKEGQLRDVHPGQPVTLTSDLYGAGVTYHGRVQGFGGGSGSAFAILPAQNATGNWIKVVQRLPTRIALDPKELQQHPLRVGLSMTVTVQTSRG